MNERMARDLAIQRMRDDPRGKVSFVPTNRFLDTLLNRCLRTSPLMNFNPSDWLAELFKLHAMLRLGYWEILRDEIFDPTLAPPTPLDAMMRGETHAAIIYTQLLLALTRIAVDRIGLFDSLPALPDDHRFPVTYLQLRSVRMPLYRERIFKHVDFICGGAGREILAMYDDVLGTEPVSMFAHHVWMAVPFPWPIASWNLYGALGLDVHGAYKEHVQPQIKPILTPQQIERAEAFFNGETFQRVKTEMAEFHDAIAPEIKQLVKENADIPAGFPAERLTKELQAKIGRKMQELGDKSMQRMKDDPPALVEGFDPLYPGKPCHVTEAGHVRYLQADAFGTDVLAKLLDALKALFAAHASANQVANFSSVLTIAAAFLSRVKPREVGGVTLAKKDIDELLARIGLENQDIKSFVHNAGSQKDLSKPWDYEGTFWFDQSLSTGNRLVLKDRRGAYHATFYWIFDAVVTRLMNGLRSTAIGRERSFKAENYVGFLIQQYYMRRFPARPPLRLFKVYIEDPEWRSPKQGDMERNLLAFKHEIIKISCRPSYFQRDQHTFEEFDLAFVHDGVLIVVEVKDDLFWHLTDVPQLVEAWGRKEKAKLAKKTRRLEDPKVKQGLQQRGISWNRIVPVMVTQGHLVSENVGYISDVYEAIERIGHDDMATFVFHGEGGKEFPPYPW